MGVPSHYRYPCVVLNHNSQRKLSIWFAWILLSLSLSQFSLFTYCIYITFPLLKPLSILTPTILFYAPTSTPIFMSPISIIGKTITTYSMTPTLVRNQTLLCHNLRLSSIQSNFSQCSSVNGFDLPQFPSNAHKVVLIRRVEWKIKHINLPHFIVKQPPLESVLTSVLKFSKKIDHHFLIIRGLLRTSLLYQTSPIFSSEVILILTSLENRK